MKKFIILIYIVAFAPVFASCEKEEPQEQKPPQEDITPIEPIGKYIYNGNEYPVHTAAYVADGNIIAVKISPLEKGRELTTYALIGIHADLAGSVIEVDKAWHNDDYFFTYEDPIMYYSQFRPLKSGTIEIIKNPAIKNLFYINVDLILPDGADFKFEYNGYLETTE